MSLLSTQHNNSQKKELFNFTQGIEVDKQLCVQEVQVQKAWLTGLLQMGLLRPTEAVKIEQTLNQALALMEANQFEWRIEDEDIHMNLERFLTEHLGELGKKIHLGRSRNDLIATTLRLYVRDSVEAVSNNLIDLIETFCSKAEETAKVIVPGTTHLQHAQPVRFGHILCGHAWALNRDLKKLYFAKEQAMATQPLGSAAMAGTTLAIDQKAMASVLGFESPSNNAYDSVGDRDFILSALDAFASIAVHLSRVAEDTIYWAASPVGLISLSKNWSTGSSIMPNKRNPDVPELVRGKAAHIIAAQNNAYVLMKALPTSYDSDLHELKSVFMRAQEHLQLSLTVLMPFIAEMSVNADRAALLLSHGHLLATEVANHLTAQGLPFREAYAKTAALTECANSNGVSIENLSPDLVKQHAPEIDQAWLSQLTFESAVETRNFSGGTSLARTLESIKGLRTQLPRKRAPHETSYPT